MITRAAPLVLLAPAVLLAGGCSSAGTPGTSRPSASSGGIASVILTDVPAGFDQRLETASHTGPTDLTKAADDDAEPGARAALISAGFRRGYQRLWTNPAGDVIAVQVYEFSDARGAITWERRVRAQAQRLAEHVTSYAVPEIPTADTGTEVDVEGDTTEQVLAVRGDYVLQVMCSARIAQRLRAREQELALAQYRRLDQSR